MMGDRYGEVVRISRQRPRHAVRAALLTQDKHNAEREIAHVKLDKSGKVTRVILADCEVI
jgi:hypothetical protein